MDGGEPFSMTFVTADRKKGTGGEIIRVANWVKARSSTGDGISTNDKKKDVNKLILGKNPNHFKNKTRNIRNLRDHKMIRKVHIRLICEFNGKKVV